MTMTIELGKVSYDMRGNRCRARTTYLLPDGTSTRIEGYGAGRREAKDKLIENIEKKVSNAMYAINPGANMTISQAVVALIEERAEEYDHGRKRLKRRPESIQRDRDSLKTLINPYHIANKLLDNVTARDIDEYMKQIKKAKHDDKYYSASSLNRAMRLVRDVINKHYKYSDKKSPAEAFELLKIHVEKKTEKDFLIDDEYIMFIRFCEEKDQNPKNVMDQSYSGVFRLILYTALRPGEAAGLRCKNWDSSRKKLIIDHTGVYDVGRTKTEDSKESFEVCEAAATLLDKYTQGKSPEDYIFPNTKGEMMSLSDARKRFKAWLTECNISKDLHPHNLRGSVGTYLLNNGMGIESVSNILRHDEVATTAKFYTTVTATRRKADHKQANDIFNAI